MTPSIVILTGAGISAESGLGTFRDKDGLWSQYDLRDVATPEGYARDPDLVLDFYNARRDNAKDAEPNAAHRALAKLDAALPDQVMLVTQNIDDLHERGGSTRPIHMHGELMKALCAACGHRWVWTGPMSRADTCPACASTGTVRPDVVWFGEMPYHMEQISDAIVTCALFVSIGTSGEVYPAAGFVAEAKAAGAQTLELNLERSAGSTHFDGHILGPATKVVPGWVESVL